MQLGGHGPATQPRRDSWFRVRQLQGDAVTGEAWLSEIAGYETGWTVHEAAAGSEDGTLAADLRHPETGQLVPVRLSLESFPSPELRKDEVLRQIAEKEQSS